MTKAIPSLSLCAVRSLRDSGQSREIIRGDELVCQDIRETIATVMITKWWRHRIQTIASSLYNMKLRRIHGRKHGLEKENDGAVNIERTYMFGVIHGEVVWYSGGYPIYHQWYTFGKRNGRSETTWSEVYDYRHGTKHGLATKITSHPFRASGGPPYMVILHLDGKSVMTRYYDMDTYETIINNTDGLYGDDWYDYVLP